MNTNISVRADVKIPSDAYLMVESSVQPVRIRKEKYPFSSLTSVGMSMYVSGKTARDVRGAIYGATQRYGHRYVSRTVENGVRIWRVQ